MAKITIVVVQPNEAWREEIVRAIRAYDARLRLVPIADPAEAPARVRQEQPAAVVVGIDPPGEPILKAVDAIRSMCPDVPIVMVSKQPTRQLLVSFMRAGGDELLEFPFDAHELMSMMVYAVRRRHMWPGEEPTPHYATKKKRGLFSWISNASAQLHHLPRWRAAKRGVFDDALGGEREPVDCTVFAPPSAHAGESVLVQVFAHIPDLSDTTLALAEEFDAAARRRGLTSLGSEIERGSRLTFGLVVRPAQVLDPIQELVWKGRTESVQFEVRIPEDLPAQVLIGRLAVTQHDVPIGQIRFKLEVVPRTEAIERQGVVTGQAKRYEVAFISYASQDRGEVVRRVQMLPLVGIRYHQDILDLDPGDRWARKLYRHIDESDVLFLFWSTFASKSYWVEREWRYGIKRKWDGFVCPVIIEGPPFPPPPAELSHLHFADKLLYFSRPDQEATEC